jgi:hydroxymethylglutaryl-CoA reductase (NADPH)
LQHCRTQANIPMKWIGPIHIVGELEAKVSVPMATFETPLWPSTNRGAKISRLTGGIAVTLLSEKMTRSIVLQAPDAAYAKQVVNALREQHQDALAQVVASTSSFASLDSWHEQILGRLLYLRFAIKTGDASGHNMATKAAEALLDWIVMQFPKLQYVSISANFCTDKKVSAVNGILGRGKSVIAEVTVPRDICTRYLRSTPEKIVDLHLKKNLLGSILAGGIRSANAHFANMLLAVYLATGQDAANIVEGSQGMVHAEVVDTELYFSVSLPNVIVGTVGNGKGLPFVMDNLARLGCAEQGGAPGDNSRRLAFIVAATVLCGELSLLAAQTNRGELMDSHLRLERMARRTQGAA